LLSNNAASIAVDALSLWPRTTQTQNTNSSLTMIHASTTPMAMYNDVGKGNLGVEYRADNASNVTAYPN